MTDEKIQAELAKVCEVLKRESERLFSHGRTLDLADIRDVVMPVVEISAYWKSRAETAEAERDQLRAERDAAVAENAKCKAILDEGLWHIDRPMPERLAALCEDYCTQQAQISDMDGELRSAREAQAKVAEVLADVRKMAVAHHADQPSHLLLHALTIDIPSLIDTALDESPQLLCKPTRMD
jgi:hypothetical protein